MQSIIIGFVRIYQFLISPILPVSCKFYPSCSEYTVTAIKTHGIIKGVGFAIFRIVRCNPWTSGGYDPVLKNKTSKINGN